MSKDPRFEELITRFKRHLFRVASRDYGAIYCEVGEFELTQHEAGSWRIARKRGGGGYTTVFRFYGSRVVYFDEQSYDLLPLLRVRQVLEELSDA